MFRIPTSPVQTGILRSRCSAWSRRLYSTHKPWKASRPTNRHAFGVILFGTVGVALLFTRSENFKIHAEAQNSSKALQASGTFISAEEIKKHTTPKSCWVVVDGEVWDLTSFLASHPGGGSAILRVAGTEAGKVFNPIHPSGTLREGLQPEAHIGRVNPDEELAVSLPESKVRDAEDEEILPLDSLVDLDDFERMAKLGLSEKAWTYYASTADDGVTFADSRASWSQVTLRPRILIDVAEVDYSTTILGEPSALPIYISPAALAKLAHDEGEVALCRGAQKSGIIQCISSNASCSLEEIHASAGSDQTLFFQLYVNRDADKAAALIRKLKTLDKIKAVYLTVDAPVGGNRTLDEKFKAYQARNSDAADSTSKVMFSGVSPSLTWSSFDEIRRALGPDVKMMIKGVSTVEDAVMAYEHGADGIVLSTHGGRQLDLCQSPLHTLLEIRKNAPHLLPLSPKQEGGEQGRREFEIHIDGGIRRGTHVLIALALGASACGLGRPFLYSLANGYGSEGVERVVGVLRNEMEIGMRLLGVRNLQELRQRGASLVNTKRIDPFIADVAIEK